MSAVDAASDSFTRESLRVAPTCASALNTEGTKGDGGSRALGRACIELDVLTVTGGYNKS